MKEWIKKIREKQAKLAEHKAIQFLNMVANLALAILAVVPMIHRLATTIPFSYEINDDSALVQILDGAYLGHSDGHAIFVRYPLSQLIAWLYEHIKEFTIMGQQYTKPNWYLITIIILSTFALVAVLFRILCFFNCNQLLICAGYDLAFMLVWSPCFFHLTFSTVAAFLGCMAILFLAFETKEQAVRPWNILALLILMVGCYGMRKSCFTMILPFIIGELLYKYHFHFFRSWKPWFVCACLGLTMFGVMKYDSHMYSSVKWKDYLNYNHARAYMQDYVGFPKYDSNRELYDKLSISKEQKTAIQTYRYCMLDNFNTDWIEEIYEYCQDKELKKQEGKDQKTILKEAAEHAKELFLDKKQANAKLKFASFYLLALIVPVLVLTIVFRWDEEKRWHSLIIHIWSLLSTAGFVAVLAAEWIYLAIMDRFPPRVEETIRILTLTIALTVLAHLLVQWKKGHFYRVPLVVQIIVVVLMMQSSVGSNLVQERMAAQNIHLAGGYVRQEVFDYCGEHPDRRYVIDSVAVIDTSRPTDDMSQGNWILSGTWMAYSPLYEQKLDDWDTETLGTQFLTKEDVYIITKGPKDIPAMLGIKDAGIVTSEVVDEFLTSGNMIYEVYKLHYAR